MSCVAISKELLKNKIERKSHKCYEKGKKTKEKLIVYKLNDFARSSLC